MAYHRPLPRRSRWSKTKSESDVQDDDEDIEDYVGSDEEETESSTTEWTEYDDSAHCEDPKSETRRERKAARKAARNKARFAGLTKGEIDKVRRVLHPSVGTIDRSPDPTDPLKDNTIKDNVAFNSSTFRYASLRTGVHQKKLLKNNVSAKTVDRERKQSQDAEIAMFIQKLGIVDTNANGGPKNRRVLLARLRESIRNELECVANEAQQRMMRMAGYWRYANRRTYNHMAQKNLIWDWETGAKLEVLEEETEANEEAISHVSNDPPTDLYLSQSKHSKEADPGLVANTVTKENPLTDIATTETSLEAPKCKKISAPMIEKLQEKSPYSGKADARHLQVPVPLVTSIEKKSHAPVEAKASIKAHLGCEKTTIKASEDVNGAAEEVGEADAPLSPTQATVDRKKSRSRSKNKSLGDKNNRFTALDGYVEEDWKTTKVSEADTLPISTSRRSSVRSVANPPATVRPSPLRNEVSTSSRAPDLSDFPELPSTKDVKPKVMATHPPAHLTAQAAANFRTQLIPRGRNGLSTSARGGRAGGADRGGRAAPINYAAFLRSRLGED